MAANSIVAPSMIVAGSRTSGNILCAPLHFAPDYVPSHNTDVVTKAYADSHGGGSSGPPQQRMLYLSTAGPAVGSTSDGLTLATAFANLYDAVAAAVAMSPTADLTVCIECTDAGQFAISSAGGINLVMPPGVEIFAPAATLYDLHHDDSPSAIVVKEDAHITAGIIHCDVYVQFDVGQGQPMLEYNTTIEAETFFYSTLYLGACRNVEININLFRGNISTNLPSTTYPTNAVICGDDFYGGIYVGSGYVQEYIDIRFGTLHPSSDSTVGSGCRIFIGTDELTNAHGIVAVSSTADLHLDASLQVDPVSDANVPIGQGVAIYYEKPLEWTVRSLTFSYVTGQSGTITVPVTAVRHGRTVTITLSGSVLASVGGYSLISAEPLPKLFSVANGTPAAYAYCTNYPSGTLHTYCFVSMVDNYLTIKSSGSDGIFPADAGTVTMSTAVLVGAADIGQLPS